MLLRRLAAVPLCVAVFAFDKGPEEPGIEAVPLTLCDEAGDQLAEAPTDANGAYLFGELCAGKYTVMSSRTRSRGRRSCRW
jgi:hypothetical protein